MAGRGTVHPRRALVIAALAAAAGAGCDAVADQVTDRVADESTTTLTPLPIATNLTAPVVVNTSAPIATSVSAPTTTAGSAVTTAPVTTTAIAPPVGDWDGARFDFGRIVSHDTTDDGRYHTIELDRYSYRDPSGLLIDAAGFSSEPLAYWWREEPWANNNPATRRFVLAPDAELLVLSESGRQAACRDPAPAALPPPTWTPVDPSFLDTEAANDAVVSITYAPTGPITRLRLTQGC